MQEYRRFSHGFLGNTRTTETHVEQTFFSPHFVIFSRGLLSRNSPRAPWRGFFGGSSRKNTASRIVRQMQLCVVTRYVQRDTHGRKLSSLDCGKRQSVLTINGHSRLLPLNVSNRVPTTKCPFCMTLGGWKTFLVSTLTPLRREGLLTMSGTANRSGFCTRTHAHTHARKSRTHVRTYAHAQKKDGVSRSTQCAIVSPDASGVKVVLENFSFRIAPYKTEFAFCIIALAHYPRV